MEDDRLFQSIFETDENNCMAMRSFLSSVDFKRLFVKRQATELSKTKKSPPRIKQQPDLSPPLNRAENKTDVIRSPIHNPQMRKLALEELNRLRASKSSQAYENLQKAYFDSLDDDSRVLIFDVKKQMQGKMFDDHLKPRLVRFMVENPSCWSTATQKPSESRG